MRFITLIFPLLLFAAPSIAQLPPVGIVEFYGLRSVSRSDVSAALAIKSGDDAHETISRGESYRQKLQSIPGVIDASINVVCCDDANGKSIVFVGIQENGASVPRFRPAPKGIARLPKSILRAGEAFQAAFMKSVVEKDFSEDDSQGHALFGNKAVRDIQESFAAMATPNLKILRSVIRGSSDPSQRALAAQVIAYAKDKKAIVPDLRFAMSDHDSSTRNEAMRALLVIGKYAKAHPELKIKVPTIEFVKMLNSLVWTDRNKSAGALAILTSERDPRLLEKIRRNAVDSLAEMARWSNPGHAEPSFKILGRIAGFSEAAIENAWGQKDRRDENVRKMVERIRGVRPDESKPRKTSKSL